MVAEEVGDDAESMSQTETARLISLFVKFGFADACCSVMSVSMSSGRCSSGSGCWISSEFTCSGGCTICRNGPPMRSAATCRRWRR